MASSRMRRLKLLVVILVMCYAVMSCGQYDRGRNVLEDNVVNIREEMQPLGVC